MSKDTLFIALRTGWVMRMAGDLRVVLGDGLIATQALAVARIRLTKRLSVTIFAKGPRSRGNGFLPFKGGALRVAIEAGAPIPQFVVAGTRRAMVRGEPA